MNSTILVVDDEIEIALALKEYLSLQKHNVLVAHNVENALGLIRDNKINLILSDIKMPGKSGLDLYQEYKEKIKTEPVIPFVLMTGFAEIITVENAFKIGINELIAKPFDLESINLIIAYLLQSESSFASGNESFFSVAIDEFMLSKTSDYNIYLKVADKYVLVTKSGQDFTKQRLDNFEKKGVTHIYLNSIDFAKYTDLQFSISTTITKRPLDESKKIRIMNQLMSSISQNSIVHTIDKKYLDKSIQAFEAYTQAALNQPQLLSILNFISTDNPDLAEQSTLKAIISSSIANLWKWNNPKIQSRIILASLLSDIGLKDQTNLLRKKRFEYTTEELKQYEQHPLTSYEMLKQIQDIPEEILYVAIQHHENATGLGFPQKLARSKTHSYSKLIHCVGVFIDATMEQQDRNNVKKILDQIYNIQLKTVSEQVLKSLYILFKIEPPKQLADVLLPSETARVI